jgi:polyhydroxyalkanoate synthesis repressor PhaR
MSASTNESVVIKKYANRRLYNTATSTYVTLEDLATMVKKGVEFNVYDAKSNEDITRSVLTQIIVEEEGKAGQNLLPISFMRRLIGFYGDNMQWLVPKYLEHSMQSLSKNQEQIRDYFQTTLGGMFPFGSTLEQMSKQNLAMFERTMRMFTPFTAPGSEGESRKEGAEATPSAAAPESQEEPSTAAAAPSATPIGKKKGRTEADDKNEEQEKAEEDAFTPASSRNAGKKIAAVPTPETARATAQSAVGGDDVQNKIAALQRQLSDLTKNKA